MKRFSLLCLSICIVFFVQAQEKSSLRISDIMQGYDWVGYSPENIFWGEQSETIYYKRNPQSRYTDTLYAYDLTSQKTYRVPPEEFLSSVQAGGEYNSDFSKKLYINFGDLYLYDVKQDNNNRLTYTADSESSARFSKDKESIIYIVKNNLYKWDRESGTVQQITDFESGEASDKTKSKAENKQQQWLEDDQLNLFEILSQQDNKQKTEEKYKEKYRPKAPKKIYTGSFSVVDAQLSPDENFVVFSLYKKTNTGKTANVPNYITKSGYTEDIPTRSKVGDESFEFKTGIYNIEKDTIYYVNTDNIPGVDQQPDFYSDYPDKELPPADNRAAWLHGPYWSDNGEHCAVEIRSTDNKDRWIMQLDLSDGELKLIDRQRDEAWIAGPGIGWYSLAKGDMGWLADNRHFWFISEESGYTHLYLYDTKKGKKKALTKGNYEVSDVRLSRDKQYWYYLSNEEHPGVRSLFKIPATGGKAQQITDLRGIGDYYLSPDEKKIAFRNSESNRPWELYLADNDSDAKARQITHSQTDAFEAYDWRKPEFISFEAEDGETVYARLYKPSEQEKNDAAVLFVHGAGYLQNAHKWWSNYYREYMFHNFLVDKGYTVLDIDYRGSAGYGREWRTGIYRHMGGKDLSDHVDGARFLIEEHGINSDKIGIYGGSYGGFISIMAMFFNNDVFKAGAAIRSVTDWAHYNHYYTSNILNEPHTDSLAYVRSSPIYHAELFDAGHLLILHGMVDTNVHFQDVVRLAQRLIELGKENWDMAVYPTESHGFKEASSWTDEYKRIYKFFEKHLNTDK
jgi:dipeptidyl aminopeptidase/acylaminoacyl peptidase